MEPMNRILELTDFAFSRVSSCLVTFPALSSCPAVGFIVTSLLDKSHLHSYGSDSWGGEGSVAWRARVVLFIGVALMAGGLAGSLVRRWRAARLLLLSLREG